MPIKLNQNINNNYTKENREKKKITIKYMG